MSVPLDEISDTILPRRYQEEIFVRAQQGNVIAALDTGSGKTLISTLLIKWMAAQVSKEHKITVFLVPKVALVQQQGEFIGKQTSLRVRQFSGATAHDMSDRTGWKEEFEDSDVFVMTAQILLNLLTHSHLSMNKISLLVFDECHHTRKNHAYNGIMREYFQSAVDDRPKVFGMTASPIWNPKNAAESLSTLERNLDAKVIAVKEHVDELAGHSPRPEELIEVYPQAPVQYPDYPKRSLRLRLNLDNTPPDIGLPVEKILTRYEVTYYSLGPFGAELFLYTEMKQRVTQLIRDAIESAMDVLTADQYAQVVEGGSLAEVPGAVHPKLREFEHILSEFHDDFEDPPDGGLPRSIPLSWCTPKVKALTQILWNRYTSTFQGIVFVEQRHIATCLAAMLRRIPLLAHIIKCEQLVGHGTTTVAKAHLKGMAVRNQQDTVQMFRDRQLNILVATSVAEEGLDFPACDLVVRFDPVQHMVGYLQSRGRARQKFSTFIIMVQEGSQVQAERYLEFLKSEPQLKKVYQQRDLAPAVVMEDDEMDVLDPDDLAQRERYVVLSTGATLTYTSAISLINYLCSLIPRDRFTPMHVPRYTGDYTATVHLPSSLPLPPELLECEGPPKRSKKEAKRAAAFLAVKRLHALNVFDDYLLPAKSPRATENEDSDGVPIMNVANVPDILNVRVRDPWVQNSTLWLHVVHLDGVPAAGLVTGTALPPTDLVANNLFISTDEPMEVVLDPRHAWSQRRAMEDYTRMGLWWCITGRGITLPLACYLVPITRGLKVKVDFDAIELAIAYPFGSYNWENIGEKHYGRIVFMNNREFGHPLLLHKLRPDVTPSSMPPFGSRESAFPTYHEYWLHKYTRKGHTPKISLDGPCVEGVALSRNIVGAYSLENDPLPSHRSDQEGYTVIFPIELCRWALMSEPVYRTFFVLPQLCRRLTDVWRAREVRTALKLPPIVDDLLVQAITLPSTNAAFNNQRLETFGDAVLKLCTVVYLYNKYPHRHEGQLDSMKRTSIANRTLLARALEHSLERHLTPETQSMRMWRYVAASEDDLFALRPCRTALRQYPRRSLQDCMEAILGASFATGGVEMALRAGTALGLSFGGTTPWYVRYSGTLTESPAAPLFAGLQEALGYTFKHGHLLLEAMTHPSFRSTDCSSYQRLEFLGDAFIDMVVTEYLYKKFPTATSGQLSWARSRAVCGPAFASVAVKKLGLHKLLLINNVELSLAISTHVPVLEEISDEEIILCGWKHDPPKALSDVLESVLGALFIDCDYNYDRAAAITEMVLEDLLAVLRPDLPKDPVSELMVWVAQAGCRCASFAKGQSRPEVRRYDTVSVLVHGTTVAGPVAAPNLSMAKGLAAERARTVLSDPASPHFLSRVCFCTRKGPAAKPLPPALPLDVPDKKELNDETDEGFAMLAQMLVDEVEDPVPSSEEDTDSGEHTDEDWDEEMEVERMMEVDPMPLIS